VARHYSKLLSHLSESLSPSNLPDQVTPRILDGLKALSIFLLEQTRRIDEKSEASPEQRKWARDHVPWDEMPKPAELAVQFRSLVLQALGRTEEEDRRMPAEVASPALVPSRKRKQSSEPPSTASKHARIKNFTAASPARSKPGGSLSAGGINGAAEVMAPNTVVSQARMGRPLEDDSIGDEEEVEVKTTTSETKLVRIVRAAGKVIRETRTVTTVVERVVWDKLEEDEEEEEEEDRDNIANMEDDENDQAGQNGDQIVEVKVEQMSTLPPGLSAFMEAQLSQDSVSSLPTTDKKQPLETQAASDLTPLGLAAFLASAQPNAPSSSLPPGISDFLPPKQEDVLAGEAEGQLPPGLSDFVNF